MRVIKSVFVALCVFCYCCCLLLVIDYMLVGVCSFRFDNFLHGEHKTIVDENSIDTAHHEQHEG